MSGKRKERIGIIIHAVNLSPIRTNLILPETNLPQPKEYSMRFAIYAGPLSQKRKTDTFFPSQIVQRLFEQDALPQQKDTIGYCNLFVDTEKKEIRWTNFEPLRRARELEKTYLGTVIQSALLAKLTKRFPQYKSRHLQDSAIPYDFREYLKKQGIPLVNHTVEQEYTIIRNYLTEISSREKLVKRPIKLRIKSRLRKVFNRSKQTRKLK